jgi:GNAT superfamily N-acetyltransferase
MTAQRFHIQSVTTAADRDTFLDVPAPIYKHDPHWVAPLRSSIAKQLEPNNPFCEYGEFQQFIAISAGQPVGRIVAAINHRLIEREGQPVGLFGYFESIEDFEVAQALLETACQWLRDRGMTVARGPIDLSTHNRCLFLVDGFDSPPMLMMPYNPPYYPEFLEKAGWQKAKDAYAYYLALDRPLPDKYLKGYRIAQKSGITFRSMNLKGKEFEEDCRSLYRIFTRIFANNWSSNARTEEEFLEDAKDLQRIGDPKLLLLAEDKGNPIGFWMGFPDYNIPLKQVNGKLDPLGILKFLWYRRKIDRARTIALGCLPEYRRKMVPLALIYLAREGGTKRRKPYKWSELSWVFEDNLPSRKIIEATGAKIYKTYRIYEKKL